MAETKYIIFTLGEQKYSMKLSKINGIEQSYNVVPFPVGTEYIKGIIHLRESVIPVYDLKARFEIDEESSVCNRQLLVTETHGLKMGFEVDNVLGIMQVDDEDIKDIPNVARSEETAYLEDVIKVSFPESDKPEIMLSISVDNIMSENDFGDISDALEKSQQEE